MTEHLTNLLTRGGELNSRRVPVVPGKGNYKPTEIQRNDPMYLNIEQAMQNTIEEHRGNRGGRFQNYQIIKVERIGNQSLMDRFNNYKMEVQRENNNRANQRMLFHGTSDPFKIVHHGFDKSEANPKGMFGGGFYFADISSKANQYVGEGNSSEERRILLCRVILGNSKKLPNAMYYDTAPSGYHSVTGVPSQNGLKYPEYVIYKSQQAYPEFLITYRIRPQT